MKLLHKAYPLGDPSRPWTVIHDPEGLVGAVIARAVERGARPELFDDEDAYAYLLAELYREDPRGILGSYDPARGVPFAAYATAKLRWALVEYQRERFGRNGQRIPPAGSVSLDELDLAPRGEAPWADRVDEALAALAGDPESGGGADLARVLADRSREAVRLDAEIRELARTPKGVSRLMAELRAELEQQLAGEQAA